MEELDNLANGLLVVTRKEWRIRTTILAFSYGCKAPTRFQFLQKRFVMCGERTPLTLFSKYTKEVSNLWGTWYFPHVIHNEPRSCSLHCNLTTVTLGSAGKIYELSPENRHQCLFSNRVVH
jgi:hypothetical protein